ncbi:MAG TPA: secretin N-terminal domain-containing protein [Stenomitos sp.]
MIKSMLGLPQAGRSARRALSPLLAASVLLGVALPATAATPTYNAVTDKTIGTDRPKLISNPTLLTLNMANADVRATLEMMGKKGGMNLIIDESVTGSVSLSLKAVPLDEAFNLVLKMKNLTARRMGTTLLIATDEVFRKKGFSGTQTILLRFDNAKVTDVETIFKQALSDQQAMAAGGQGAAPAPGGSSAAGAGAGTTDPNIKIIKDERTNSLLVTAPEEMIDRARALKALLDVPTPQVEIEVKMLETTETGSRQLGVNYGFGGAKFGAGFNNPSPDGTAGGAGNQAGNPSTGAGGMSLTYNALGNFTANFNARIDALVQNGLAKVMANPKVVAQDNQQATITISNKIPYTKVTSNDRVVVTSQEFVDVNQTLQIKPRVDTAGFVTLEMQPTISVAGTSAPGNLPPVDIRTINTTMRVRDNESIVIGGLKRTQVVQSTSKIPVLGDVPLIGSLFRRNTSDEVQTDIVLIVTPRIQTRLQSTGEINTDTRPSDGGDNAPAGGGDPTSGPPKF